MTAPQEKRFLIWRPGTIPYIYSANRERRFTERGNRRWDPQRNCKRPWEQRSPQKNQGQWSLYHPPSS